MRQDRTMSQDVNQLIDIVGVSGCLEFYTNMI
jgi:hypothetical protein